MKKEDLLLLLLAIFLILAAFLTIFFGKGKSRHGYGARLIPSSDMKCLATENVSLLSPSPYQPF